MTPDSCCEMVQKLVGSQLSDSKMGSNNPMVFLKQHSLHNKTCTMRVSCLAYTPYNIKLTTVVEKWWLGDEFFFGVLQPTFRGSTAVSFGEGSVGFQNF